MGMLTGATFKLSIRFQIMPKGLRGQKRPADVIGTVVKIMRITTGEEQEDFGAAKSLAQRGREGPL
jgi:hypothetical protein